MLGLVREQDNLSASDENEPQTPLDHILVKTIQKTLPLQGRIRVKYNLPKVFKVSII